ncbi:MAG: hypothetical protein ABI467_16510 [Kofleriaceae bacterium]
MLAFKQLGFSMQQARGFVEQAAELVSWSISLEELVVAALRMYRRSTREARVTASTGGAGR